MRAVDAAGADQHVQLVDKDDDLSGGRLDLGQHGLQPLLELAAELGAGEELRQVERQHAPVLQPSGTSPAASRWASPSTTAVLPTPGSPISTGIVLGAARQHLDRAADLVVAADHRVELAVLRFLGQVAGVFGERLPILLGRRRVGLAALAQLLDGLRPTPSGSTAARANDRLQRRSAAPGSRAAARR